MLPTLAKLSQARANISTPHRLKLGEMLSTFSETLPAPLSGFEKIEELSDNMDVDPMDRLQEMGMEWKKMVKNFDILESEHQIRHVDETRYREGLSKAVGDIQDAVSASDRKTQLLVTQIGTESSQDGGLSLWEAVERTEETVLKGKRKFEEHCRDQVEMGTKYLSLKAKVGETEESMTNLSGHYRLTMEGVKRQLLDLRSSAMGFGKPILGIRDRLGLAHGAAWSKHEVLEESVRALEKRMDRKAKGGGNGAGPTVYERAELEGVRSAVNNLDM
jgi:hypothetical protein